MNITIRHAEPNDYEALHVVFSGQQVVWGTLQIPFSSVERRRKRLIEVREGRHLLVACDDDVVIGYLSLTIDSSPRRRHVASIGMAIHDNWQGKGVGSVLMTNALDVADNWLNIIRIELQVWIDNKPAISLYNKFGFTVEGTHHFYVFRNGDYVSAHTMARIKRSHFEKDTK